MSGRASRKRRTTEDKHVHSSSAEETGPAAELSATAVHLFSLILEHGASRFPKKRLRELKRSLGSLRLWRDGYGLDNGDLDRILVDSKRLRKLTHELLLSLCRTLANGLAALVLVDADHDSHPLLTAGVDDTLKRVEKFRSIIDINGSGSDSDDDFDSGLDGASLDLEDVVEDLKTSIQCLVNLGPRYEEPVKDKRVPAPLAHAVVETQSQKGGLPAAAAAEINPKLPVEQVELKPESYQKEWDRLRLGSHTTRRSTAVQIFRLIAGANRPLKISEIQAASSVEVAGNQVSTYSSEYQLHHHIHNLCGAFIGVSDEMVDFINPSAKTFVLRRMKPKHGEIECQWILLILKYLSMDCFRSNLTDEEIRSSAKDGSYALMDYATAHWLDHLQQFTDTASVLFGYPEHASWELETQAVMSKFLEFYRIPVEARQSHSPIQNAGNQTRLPHLYIQLPSITSKPTDRNLPNTFIRCQAFASRVFYSELLSLLSYVRVPQPLPHLGDVLKRSHAQIAELYSTESEKDNIQRLYGARNFKCLQRNCRYFYEGFATKGEAETHSSEHNRGERRPGRRDVGRMPRVARRRSKPVDEQDRI